MRKRRRKKANEYTPARPADYGKNLFCAVQKSLSEQGKKNYDQIRWDK
jgi:hypothetical protein